MTQLLLKCFVKDHLNSQDPHVRAAIGSLAGWVGIGCNLMLFGVKLLLGLLTGSVSITADALNNLSDASGSIVTLVGFRVADKPADEDHPYGHARAEYLSSLAVAVMILFIGLELGKSSLEKIFHPTSVAFSALGVGILVLSILAKLWLCLFYRTLGKKIQSTALFTSAADSRNDCVATSGVLIAALLEQYCHLRVDGFFGLAIALFILWSGWQMVGDTVSALLGENADPQLRSQILDCVSQYPKVLGCHDLMVHDYGPAHRYASLHVEMDCREDPMECRALIEDMEWKCLRRFQVNLVIHYDPIILDDPEVTRLKEKTQALLRECDPRLDLHDFRMTQGAHHINLRFHVPLPQDLKGQETAISSRMEDAVSAQEEKDYHVNITFDSTAFN